MPLISIIESLQVDMKYVSYVNGYAEVYKLRDEYIPILRLNRLFNLVAEYDDLDNGLLVVVEAEGQQFGLFVDELLNQQQVVIKSLETNFKKIVGVSGATILGNGTVALILDLVAMYRLYRDSEHNKIENTFNENRVV